MMRSVLAMLALLLAIPAHAAQRHGMTLKAMIADCRIDARSNPFVLSCPAGCTVTIANGVTLDSPPRVQVGAACQGLR